MVLSIHFAPGKDNLLRVTESQSSRLTSVAYLHVHAVKRQFPVGAQRPELWGLSACLSVNSGNEQPHEPDPCGQPFSVGPLT